LAKPVRAVATDPPVPLPNVQDHRLDRPPRLIRERPILPLDPFDERTGDSRELLGDFVDVEGVRSLPR
jgi:hypothetical protein